MTTVSTEVSFCLPILTSIASSYMTEKRRSSSTSGTTKLIQAVVLKTWSESAAVMVCSNVCRGRR